MEYWKAQMEDGNKNQCREMKIGQKDPSYGGKRRLMGHNRKESYISWRIDQT